MLGWGWRCPDAHPICSVNSVMPQALSESPAIDPREDGRLTEHRMLQNEAGVPGMWPGLTPGSSLCGFSLCQFHSLLDSEGSPDELGNFVTFFFFFCKWKELPMAIFFFSLQLILSHKCSLGLACEKQCIRLRGSCSEAKLEGNRLPASTPSALSQGRELRVLQGFH